MIPRFIALLAWMLIIQAVPAICADPIKIGMSAPFTGPSRSLGIEYYRGAMAYINQVNAQGGVHGRPITLIAYDDGYNPLPALKNTVRLIDSDQVLTLFNYVGTPTITRVLPLLKTYAKKDVMVLFPLTGAQPQRDEPYRRFALNLRPSYRAETKGLVDHFVRIGRPRIAVFYQIDSYGRSGWDGVDRALEAYDLNIAAEATYVRGDTFSDSYEAAAKIIAKAKPDAVILVGSYQACAGFIRDFRNLGQTIPVANVSFVGSEKLLSLLETLPKRSGVDYTRDLINSQVIPSYLDRSIPAVRQYQALMTRQAPTTPRSFHAEDYRPIPMGYTSFEGFLNAKLLVSLLRSAPPGVDRAGFRRHIDTRQNISIGLSERISFSPQDNQALNRVYYTHVVDGRFVTIRNWEHYAK